MGNSGSLQERQVVPGPENPTKERAGVETRPVGGLRSIWSPRRPGSTAAAAGPEIQRQPGDSGALVIFITCGKDE